MYENQYGKPWGVQRAEVSRKITTFTAEREFGFSGRVSLSKGEDPVLRRSQLAGLERIMEGLNPELVRDVVVTF